jgi:hypothetical protein
MTRQHPIDWSTGSLDDLSAKAIREAMRPQ